MRRIDTRLAPLQRVAFSRDGKYLACVAQAGSAVYRVDGFERVAEFREYFNAYLTLVSFDSGATLFGFPVEQQNRVRLWDLIKGEEFASLEEPDTPNLVAFAPGGDFLVTSGYGYARLYRLGQGSERITLPGHFGGVPGVTFSPDASQITSIGKDRTLKVWDAVSGRLLRESRDLPGPGQSAAYSPDGRLLVTGDYASQLVWIWDTQTGKRLGELGTNQTGLTWSAQFSPDGRYLVAGGSYGIRIWRIELAAGSSPEPALTATLWKSLDGACWNIRLSPDGRHLGWLARDPRSHGLHVWNFQESAPPLPVTADLIGNVQSFSFTPDGSRLLLVATNRAVGTWAVATQKRVSAFDTVDPKRTSPWTYTCNLCLSPDGAKLAMASISSAGVDLWEPKTGQLLFSLPEANGTVWWLAWSPDSQRLAVSRSNGDVTVWNLKQVEKALAELGLSQ